MKAFKRIVAMALCLVMALSVMGMVAFADDGVTTTAATIDTEKKGSITVHKYEKGTGETADGTGEETTVTGHKPLEGVTFALYQVMTQDQMLAYYNGTDATAVTVNTFVSTNDAGEYVVTNKSGETVTASETLTTDSTGVVVFDGIYDDATTGDDGTKTDTNNGKSLPLGMYVIIETSAPAKVTVAEAPFLVSVPMTKASNDSEWLYDINVYPKNSTSEGNVTLKKTDKSGTALAGVVFKLEKADSEPVTDTTTWTDQKKNMTTGSNGEVAWESLAHGTYRITEVSAPAGYIVDERPIQFTIDENSKITCNDTRACITVTGNASAALTITLINEKPDSKKEITAVNGTAVTGTDVKEANASVGDVITYKVTVDVPENITELKTFTLTDTPSNLKYKSISSITCNGTDVAEGAYTASAEGNGYKIVFTPSAMTAYAGEKIVITYTATLLSSAADATAAPNTATLTYTNKINTDSTPDGDGDTYDIEDGAVVYTYKLGVIKYKDKVASGNELPNVEFKLYTTETGGTALSVVEEAVGTYRLATSTDTTTTTTLKTDANGKIVVKGLANGTYYLEETKTVDGYNLLKGRVAVNLQISTKTEWNSTETYDENGVLIHKTYKTATHTSNDGDDTTTDLLNTTIVNKKGFDLPTTGGIGTLMFIVIGAVLIGGGVCLLAPSKKRAR